MNIEEIQQIITAVSESTINEFSLEQNGTKLSLCKKVASSEPQKIIIQEPVTNIQTGQSLPLQQLQPVQQLQQSLAQQPVVVVEQSQPVQETKSEDESLHYITAPIVGTFYGAPSPDAEAFIQEGDQVKKGDTLFIIEAMKLMNEIESDIDGTVVKILVDNAHPVEYGTQILAVRPN
ncbi:MAG: acetyl-CoA carboxylase biotin carboxyl carrier protein [bacterium]|jgi:acetyl-CoA carboxylase biotin carboxyl carrier protein